MNIKKPLKIVIWTKWIDDIFLGSKPPDGIGGAEVQLAYWAKAFAYEKNDVYTFGWRKNTISKKLYGVRFLWVPWIRKVGVIFNPLRFIYLRIIRPDVVIIRSTTDYIKLLRLRTKLGFKLVYMLASDKNVEMQHENYTTWQLNLKNADVVVAQNEYQLKKLKDNLKVSKVYYQSNIFDQKLFDIPLNSENRAFDFIWLGNLKQLKRPEWFVALAKSLPQYSFIMAGKVQEPYYSSNEFTSKLMEIPNLSFKGFVSLQESIVLLNKSKILVNTSEYEGFPNTFIQAIEFGCGIIGTVNPNDILSTSDIYTFVENEKDLKKESINLCSLWKFKPVKTKTNLSSEVMDLLKCVE